MDETPTAVACDRIEAAIVRIEAALAKSTPDDALRRRHHLLREAAASSLLTIDALIAAHDDDKRLGAPKQA